MNKLRVTALLLAVILAVGGIVLKICGYDAQTDFEPTLPLDTGLSSEQAQKDLKYVYDTVRAKHPVFLIDDGAEKRFGDVYIKLRRELMDKDSVTVKELWEKSAELVCTLDDAHTIVTVSGTEYVNGGNEISKAYNDSAYWTVHLIGCNDVSIDGISILNNLKIRNGDGIDVDHSKNVRIANCHIESGDDCICLKNRREFEE
mgnify:CR=1 FL=1